MNSPGISLFAQIRKVDEEKRLVYGRLTQEAPDRAGEIMDYEASKPYIQKWVEDTLAATGGRSQGNLRAMHSTVAAGKFSEVIFNDDEKAVDVVAKVVDDNEWEKVLDGVYTGFSIGGRRVGAYTLLSNGLKKFVVNPNEGSLVDRPSLPTATFFEIQKRDGSIEKREFSKEPETALDAIKQSLQSPRRMW
jgi:hypothetical protein